MAKRSQIQRAIKQEQKDKKQGIFSLYKIEALYCLLKHTKEDK